MVCALLAGVFLAAAEAPEVVSLEVGLVRVTPHRPGTDQTWVIPAEKKRAGTGFCGLLAAAGLGTAGVSTAVATALCETGFTPPPASAQRRLETSPDIYIRLSGQKVLLRSYTVPRILSSNFKWRALVPTAAIPPSGLVLEVLNDDGGPDEDGREVIGQTHLTSNKLLEALNTGGLITVTDAGIEKLELVVEAASTEPRRKVQRLDVHQGMVAVENLAVAAGEVVEVQARGEYRVGRAAPVTPAGSPEIAARPFQDGPFKAGPPGAAMVRVGKRRLATGALVTPCAAFLSPYEGFVFAGINSQDPTKAQGDLEFDVTVRPATDAEWRTGSADACAASEPISEDEGLLRKLTSQVVRRLRADPAALAVAILKHTHPTGRAPMLRSIQLDPSPKTSARLVMTVDWKGGVLGGDHATTIVWEFNTHRHIAASVLSDSGNVAISPEYRKRLDAWFRDQVYFALK